MTDRGRPVVLEGSSPPCGGGMSTKEKGCFCVNLCSVFYFSMLLFRDIKGSSLIVRSLSPSVYILSDVMFRSRLCVGSVETHRDSSFLITT